MESSLPFIRSPREETYLEVQWLRLHAFKKKKTSCLTLLGVQVGSMFRELRSCMPHSLKKEVTGRICMWLWRRGDLHV